MTATAVLHLAQRSKKLAVTDRDLIKTKRASTRKGGHRPSSTAAEWSWGWGYRGMGGNVTTVLDMHRWDRALRDGKLLDEESLALLHTPVLNGYACGWNVGPTDRGTTRAWHTGGVAGYGTKVVRYVEDDAVVIVLSNDGKAAWRMTDALEALLFEPAKITAKLDVGPYELGQYANATLGEKARWKATRTKGELLLSLMDGKHAALELTAPVGYATKIAAELEQAIRTREADDDGGAAAIEAGVYMSRYGGKTKRLTEKLSVEIKPEYRGTGSDGQPVVDRRVLFILKDAAAGMWPVMAKMNVAAARELLSELK